MSKFILLVVTLPGSLLSNALGLGSHRYALPQGLWRGSALALGESMFNRHCHVLSGGLWSWWFWAQILTPLLCSLGQGTEPLWASDFFWKYLIKLIEVTLITLYKSQVCSFIIQHLDCVLTTGSPASSCHYVLDLIYPLRPPPPTSLPLWQPPFSGLFFIKSELPLMARVHIHHTASCRQGSVTLL